ncbi:MAG: hypothetical protein KF846_13040 [Cyclobacteriaceae bacterium]|nr:hypothetical protein [Cyclobacteriaceae bacterium]MBX2957081.1 hypothetical protein [Cyclobacteriaceae bacterium]
MIARKSTLFILLFLLSQVAMAQDDLLKMLEDETEKDKKPDYTTATFKTTRLINGHSVENVAGGVLDFRISHRFGYINSGLYEFFGLDQATTRLGLDYGLTNRWMIGIGRSTFEKQLDGFTKYKLIRQSSGAKKTPVTVSLMAAMVYKTIKPSTTDRENFKTSNLYYTYQILVARKFNESLSLQLMPSMNHYNLVPGTTLPNDFFSLGFGGRLKVSKRVTINAEYYYQFPNSKLPDTTNSLGIGVDIETGGHVFQLYLTNSTGMTERSFITETTGDFLKGEIHFGFCISRVFTIRDPRK